MHIHPAVDDLPAGLPSVAALRARCGDDVVRLRSAREAIVGFPRRLLPIKRWIILQSCNVRELGEAFVRCAPGLRELHLFDHSGTGLLCVSFRESLASVDQYVWLLMHNDQRPAAGA